jgi:NhaA family Na+:H+ antiporter
MPDRSREPAAPDDEKQHGHPPHHGWSQDLWRAKPVWIASDRTLARWVGRPVATFLHVESAGGVVLLIATAQALILANSPWADYYEAFWTTVLEINLGPFTLAEDLRHWVNDLIMVFFFFVVGLEIKYELVAGELRDRRAAAVPALAALGGMVVPAAFYLLFNAGGEGAAGWGIPMATDIAFAMGVLAVLGPRVPLAARIFLLTLAIVDDIGAIAVIAIFYTDDLSLPWLGVAAAGVIVVIVLQRLHVWSREPYILLGAVIWLATFESGVHATIAGVVLGLLTPARPLLNAPAARRAVREAADDDDLTTDDLRRLRFLISESTSPAEWLARALHPWTAYFFLPMFAFANAGIPLSGEAFVAAAGSPVTLGIFAGLVLGKLIGITGVTWLAVRSGVGPLPRGSNWLQVAGLSLVAGIGFTVSLFITGLAFDYTAAEASEAKIGILIASFVAAVAGAAVLILAGRRTAAGAPDSRKQPIDERVT